MFFDIKMYVYSESLFNTNKKQTKGRINALFLFSRAPPHHRFTFNLLF